MMDLLPAIGMAAWLGLLTAISPCPMATNIAAISFLGRRVANPRAVLLAGLLYTLGRTAAYLGVAMIAVWGLMALPQLSQFLQSGMNQILGPLLILVGMFLTNLISLPWAMNFGGGLQDKVGSGWWWPLILGILFALSFCPVSAALFFGSLVPLATKAQSVVLVPVAYGVATAIPVVIVAILVAMGTRSIGAFFNAMTTFDRWARLVTGTLFILVGLYLTCIHVFGIAI
jgi:cytochrome c biogenesis protein CcdA